MTSATLVSDVGLSLQPQMSLGHAYVSQDRVISNTSVSSTTHLFAKEEGSFSVQVDELTYKITKKRGRAKEEKLILDGVSCVAHPGQILGVAGPSGAGKSMLLDALGGRIARKSLEGDILVNGRPVDGSFKKVSGYVQQDDLHFPHLTVRETLTYSAKLRLPGRMTSAEKRERVESLLTQLGLQECADVIVGNAEIRGISGGQRRRVSIGVELVHDPRVLLLDEPTSGLDSHAANSVIQILHDLAEHERRTIILTIHQPSFAILGLIHKFLILAKGQAVFYGTHDAMVKQFQGVQVGVAQGNALECALDVIESDHSACKRIQSSDLGTGPKLDLDLSEDILSQKRKTHPKFATSFWNELLVLSERQYRNIFRTSEMFYSRIILFFLAGFISGTVFFQSPMTPKGLNNRIAFFGFVLACVYFTASDGISIVIEERQIYIREASRGAYRTLSYVISSALVFLPFLFIITLVFGILPYFMIGLAPTAGAFFFFIATLFMCFAVANSFVFFLASVSTDAMMGNSIHMTLTGVFYLFSGFFIRSDAIPVYWQWLSHLSLMKYPLQLFILNEVKNQDTCWDGTDADSELCVMNTQAVLETWEVSETRAWEDFVFMVAFFVGYRLLFYIMLKLFCKGVRK